MRFVKLLTERDDVVLDCFMGSGTTAVASIQHDRKFIGIELLEKYVHLAEKNISRALSLNATRSKSTQE